MSSPLPVQRAGFPSYRELQKLLRPPPPPLDMKLWTEYDLFSYASGVQ